MANGKEPDGYYKESGDNHRLRFALWTAWGRRCHYCTEPLEFTAVNIDHIIPKSMSAAELKLLIIKYGLPADFDVHFAHNLAPICGDCNGAGKKGDRARALKDGLAAGDLLEKAASRADRVVKASVNLNRTGPIGGSLVAIAESAPAADPKMQGVLDAHFSDAVAVVARYKPELLTYTSTERTVWTLGVDFRRVYDGTVSLDEDSRFSVRMLRTFGINVELDVFVPALNLFVDRIEELCVSELENIEGPPAGGIEVDPGGIDDLRIDIERVALRHDDTNGMLVTVSASMVGEYVTFVTAQSINGDEPQTEQADVVFATGPFTAHARVAIHEDQTPTVDLEDDVDYDKAPTFDVSCALSNDWDDIDAYPW